MRVRYGISFQRPHVRSFGDMVKFTFEASMKKQNMSTRVISFEETSECNVHSSK